QGQIQAHRLRHLQLELRAHRFFETGHFGVDDIFTWQQVVNLIVTGVVGYGFPAYVGTHVGRADSRSRDHAARRIGNRTQNATCRLPPGGWYEVSDDDHRDPPGHEVPPDGFGIDELIRSIRPLAGPWQG